MFDEGSDDEVPVVKKKSQAPVGNLSATAKLRMQLADFLGVEDESSDADEDVNEMETVMEEQVEGARGQFRRGGVLYDLNDAPNGKEADDDEHEDREPARKKAKTSKGKPKKIDKDMVVHMKIKSTLEALEKSNQTRAELEDEDDGVEMASEDEEVATELKWKDNLAQKASEAFYQRLSGKGNLRKLVYGTETANELDKSGSESDEEDDGDDDRLGGLFKIASEKRRERQSAHSTKDHVDCTRFVVEKLQDWSKSGVLDSIRDCFVTGKWKESEDAEELLAMDDLEMDSEGDFEDLETGELSKVKPKKPEESKDVKKDAKKEEDESPEETRRKLIEKKRKLKEQFDAEYDDQKEGKGKTYYDELKEELDQQAKMNKNEFEDLDDDIRVQYEGFRPGMYIRMEIDNVPCELVTNFNPSYPLIVGALLAGEENIGFVQVHLLNNYLSICLSIVLNTGTH